MEPIIKNRNYINLNSGCEHESHFAPHRHAWLRRESNPRNHSVFPRWEPLTARDIVKCLGFTIPSNCFQVPLPIFRGPYQSLLQSRRLTVCITNFFQNVPMYAIKNINYLNTRYFTRITFLLNFYFCSVVIVTVMLNKNGHGK